MGILLKSTIYTFRNEVININLDRNYLEFNNTFPAVSICMIRGKTREPMRLYLNEYHQSQPNGSFDMNKLMTHVKVAQTFLYHSPMSQLEEFQYCEKQNESCGLNLTILTEKFAVKECDEAIIAASYKGKNYTCKDLFVKYRTDMGLCFTTNSVHSV